MDSQPYHLNIMFSPKYAIPVFGYAVPPIAVTVLIVNFVMAMVLLQKDMRTPANHLMLCMSILDTAAVLFPVVPFVYFYTLGNYEEFVPFPWCRVFYLLVHVLPLLANMASLWLVVALAVMRCYSVWRPLNAKRLITLFRTNMIILGILAMSIIVYIPPIFEYSYTPISTSSLVENNSTITTCHMQKTTSHVTSTLCTVHTWVQIVFTSLLPWFLITFPDVGLLWKLKNADDNRRMLQGGIDRSSEKAVDETLLKSRKAHISQRRIMTWVIFVIVSMVWLVEIPFAIIFTEHLVYTNGDVMRKPIGANIVFVFLLKYITYPIIFLISCFMSQRFRKTFVRTVLRGRSTKSGTENSATKMSSQKSSGRSVIVE